MAVICGRKLYIRIHTGTAVRTSYFFGCHQVNRTFIIYLRKIEVCKDGGS